MDVLQYLLLSAAEDTQLTLPHSKPNDDHDDIHVITATYAILLKIIPVHSLYYLAVQCTAAAVVAA